MADVQKELVTMTVKAVTNAMFDHYKTQKSELSWEEYWKKHLKLTGFKTVDTYIQEQVNACVDDTMTSASILYTNVMRSIGFKM